MDRHQLRAGKFNALIDFQELAHRTALTATIINREQPVDVEALSSLLPEAVHRARTHFTTRRNAFENAINAQLNEELAALDEFKARRLAQLEEGTPNAAQSRQEITEIHNSYLEWIEESMTTEPHPSIKVICALTP